MASFEADSSPSLPRVSLPEMTQVASFYSGSLSASSTPTKNSRSNISPRTPTSSPLSQPQARRTRSAPSTGVQKSRKARRSVPGSFPEPTTRRSSLQNQPSVNESEPEDVRTLYQIPPTPSQVDDRVRKRVKEPLTSKKVLDEAKGYVYIFGAADQPGTFKIGSTDRTVTERKEEIERSCGRILVEHYRSELLPFAQRAEKLCHDMLSFYRRRYHCSRCKGSVTVRAVQHEEWFEVSLDVAQNCVDLWTNFLQDRPYHADGKLSLFWCERLKNTKGCFEGEAHCDHQLRHQRWQTFVSASYLARVSHWMARVSHWMARVIRECKGIDFWRSWFNALLLVSFFVFSLYDWIGDMAPLLQLIISLGYFLPAWHIQETKGGTV